MTAHLDAAVVRAEIAQLLAAYPELAEDEVLRLDMLTGETKVEELCSRLLAEKLEADTMVAAIKARGSDLAARSARFERKADAMKVLIRSVMEAAGLPKLPLPEATLSISQGRPSVEVIVLEDLPQGFFSTEIKPDKRALFAALQAGEHVPGARLAPGKPSLTVRTK